MAEQPRWEKVKEISTQTSGLYVFADNLLDRPSGYKPLPNGERPNDNVVGSERPRWEELLPSHLCRHFPETRFLTENMLKGTNPHYLMAGKVAKELALPWLRFYRTYSGLLIDGDCCYRMYRGTHGDPTTDTPNLFIEDVDMPEFKDGKWKFRTLSLERNGEVALSLTGSRKVDKRGPYWRGEVRVRAHGGRGELVLGDFLKEAVLYLNEEISKGIPLWRDIKFVDWALHPTPIPIS